MVLSLTTEPDGNEGRYAQLVAEELGVPPLDVKVVPADESRFGTGHGFNTSPSGGTPDAIASAAGKIRAKAQLLAGAALETPADGLRWDDGAFVGARPARRRSPTSRSTRTAPARCRPASRAGSTRRPSTGTDVMVDLGPRGRAR